MEPIDELGGAKAALRVLLFPRGGDLLPRGLHKRARDAQRRVDILAARIEVEGRIDRIEKKLRKLGDLFK